MANTVKVLTLDQLKRFRRFLVQGRFFSTTSKATKATDTPIKCRAIFMQLTNLIDDFEGLSIEDIYDVYCAPDESLENRVDDKVVQAVTESNYVDNIAVQAGDDTNCMDNISAGVEPDKKRKGRGKQKAPSMIYYQLAIPGDMLQQLRELEGTVSEHIRRAISFYLKTIKPQD